MQAAAASAPGPGRSSEGNTGGGGDNDPNTGDPTRSLLLLCDPNLPTWILPAVMRSSGDGGGAKWSYEVGQVSNSIAENSGELSLEIFDEAELQDFSLLFVDTLKAGWPVEKLTSKGKFAARTLNLSDDEETISWVSLKKRTAVSFRIGAVRRITFGYWPSGTTHETGAASALDRAVTVYTIEDNFEFRMRDVFDAQSFVKGIVSVIKLRDPRRHDIAKAKAEEEARLKAEQEAAEKEEARLQAERDLQAEREAAAASAKASAKAKAKAKAKEEAEQEAAAAQARAEEEAAADAASAVAVSSTPADAGVEETKDEGYQHLIQDAKKSADCASLTHVLQDNVANTRATCECLGAINEVCIENDERRNEFGRAGANEAIVGAMQTHLVDAAVQISSLNVVRTLVKKNRSADASYNADRFCAASGAAAVAETMKHFSENLELQETSIGILHALSSRFCEEWLRLANSCENICSAMKTHPMAANLQSAGCAALAQLVADSTLNVRRICNVGGPEILVAAMERHQSGEGVQINGCVLIAALANPAKDDIVCNRLCKAGACEAVVGAMRRFAASMAAQNSGCHAITALSSDDDGRSKLGFAGACERLVQVVKNHSDSDILLLSALDAILATAEDHDENLAVLKENDLDALIGAIDGGSKSRKIEQKIAEVERLLRSGNSFWQNLTGSCSPTAAPARRGESPLNGCNLFGAEERQAPPSASGEGTRMPIPSWNS